MYIPSSGDLADIVREVWRSFLADEPTTLEKVAETSWMDDKVTGCVQISGAYMGSVTVECSTAAARDIAAALFGTPSEDVTDDEITDSVGEIANMIGGNVKSMLPAPSQLSLPAVAHGHHSWLAVPGVELARDVHVGWRDRPVLVSLLQKRTED